MIVGVILCSPHPHDAGAWSRTVCVLPSILARNWDALMHRAVLALRGMGSTVDADVTQAQRRRVHLL